MCSGGAEQVTRENPNPSGSHYEMAEGALGVQVKLAQPGLCQGCEMDGETERLGLPAALLGQQKQPFENKSWGEKKKASMMICKWRSLTFNGEWSSVKAAVGEGSEQLSLRLCFSPPARPFPGPFGSPQLFSPPTVCGFLFLFKPLGHGVTPDARAQGEENSNHFRVVEASRDNFTTNKYYRYLNTSRHLSKSGFMFKKAA